MKKTILLALLVSAIFAADGARRKHYSREKVSQKELIFNSRQRLLNVFVTKRLPLHRKVISQLISEGNIDQVKRGLKKVKDEIKIVVGLEQLNALHRNQFKDEANSLKQYFIAKHIEGKNIVLEFDVPQPDNSMLKSLLIKIEDIYDQIKEEVDACFITFLSIEVGKTGDTLLMKSAWHEQHAIYELLKENGSDVNYVSSKHKMSAKDIRQTFLSMNDTIRNADEINVEITGESIKLTIKTKNRTLTFEEKGK